MHQKDGRAYNIPSLRRYARALTGDVQLGRLLTQLAIESCEQAQQSSVFDAYHAISNLWLTRFPQFNSKQLNLRNPEQVRIASMRPAAREAFLLTSLEGFTVTDAAIILSTTADNVQRLVASALDDVRDLATSRVLIIEDEFFIARHLEKIVCDLGHVVAAKARTMTDAVQAFEREQPDLVLSDIAIDGDGSGIAAVLSMIRSRGSLPAVFISAYPERLLCEKRPQPTYIIGKPFTDEAVRTAIAQLLYFDSGSYHSPVTSAPVGFTGRAEASAMSSAQG